MTHSINLDEMTKPELESLRAAIIAEVKFRIRAYQAILTEREVRKVQSVRRIKGGRGRLIAYPDELFITAAKDGLTVKEAAERIGCHGTLVRQKEAKLGIAFRKVGSGNWHR